MNRAAHKDIAYMTARPRTVISIGGVSYSGSTMLALILGNHRQSFACGEAVNLFRPMHTHHFTPLCACGQQPCPVWSRLRDVEAPTFYRTLFSVLDVHTVIDSSKELSWLVDADAWVRSTLPGANHLYIFAYKDPLDLAYSFWKRGRHPMFWRSQFVVYYRRLLALDLPLLTVDLSALLASPASKTRHICQLLRLPYAEHMEQFWNGAHHQIFGNLGVRWQTQAGQSAFQNKSSRKDDGFARYEDDIRRSIAGDAEVQHIVSRLDAAEVGRQDHVVRHRDALRRPYPAWYYRQRLRRMYRGHFPRPIDWRVAESAATAPQRHANVDDGR